MNPLDGNGVAQLGLWTAYGGDWERGLALLDRAMKLNPRHVGWYWYPQVHNAYRERDYAGALEYAMRINLPDQFWTQILFASIYAQLGFQAAATDAVRYLLRLQPDFQDSAERVIGRWFAEKSHVDHILEGLRKAGLRVA